MYVEDLFMIIFASSIFSHSPYCQGYSLPSGHIMWELYRKQERALKNWCLWTVGLEETPESPLGSKEIKPVNLKGNQFWMPVGRTDAEAETIVFCSSDTKRWFMGKVPDSGKHWGLKKRASEDEMAGWHHQCDGHELGQTSLDGEGQGGLVCCSSWGHKELDMIGQLKKKQHIIWYPLSSCFGLLLVCLYLYIN